MLFHFFFNIALALLFIFWTEKIARVAERLLPNKPLADDPAKPRNLDPSALDTPPLAIANAAREAMRIGDVVEDMLIGMLTVIKTNDRELAQRLRKKDDVVDDLYTAVKLYLTQISREALDEKEGRRWADIVSFTINLEQVGDIIERVLNDIDDKKISKHRSFSDAGMAEICDLHARLVANLRLGMSVFLHGDLKSAQELLAQKVLFRDLERAYADSHLGRLAGNTLESIETSSLHLDLISDLKRINSHICSIAYPILEEAGVLARTRLKEPAPLHRRRRRSSPSRSEEQARRARPEAARDGMALSISDICILFGRKGGRAYDGEPVTQLEHALQTAARAEESGRDARARHRGAAARPRPPPERPGRHADAARRRRPPPVRGAAVPAHAVRRRRAGADQAARRRQALPVRDAARLLRRAVERLQAQPRAAGRHLLAGRGGGLHRAAAMRRTPCRCGCGTTSPRSPGAPTPPLAHFVPVLEAAQRTPAADAASRPWS